MVGIPPSLACAYQLGANPSKYALLRSRVFRLGNAPAWIQVLGKVPYATAVCNGELDGCSSEKCNDTTWVLTACHVQLFLTVDEAQVEGLQGVHR